MKHIVITLIAIASLNSLNAQIKGPVTINNPKDLELQTKIHASALADQWADAFKVFKATPGVNLEIVTSKDGLALTLSNIHTLESTAAITKGGNLLYAVQRIGNRDYTVVLDPRQIRYIRQMKAD
ncbi:MULTISPECIES: hypothetical protein [unclassified Lentimonas]|uniref:hypothetical protein n=1 Tax=unclassified Lentimonas TaxID=2630993 RepID=UPI001327E33A|nr:MULTISPECIES: hypothetical protein [unclassified Lentimonas]CAA6678696.1 Unannotated [Lentimonas sp. CC4]CAA6683682.1 Unannotated [Lentimonas sp. CC6]CAA6691287.1 Unannotated [Lentimonas sp. CC19]CAA6694872.1 Unannotated [Lentimonas sp. CC10]CAA7071936.1 Unannotated [Lentimonas sp. CC11]